MHRRQFLTLLSGAALAPALAVPIRAAEIVTAQLRGSINGAELGLRPGAIDDQSRAFQDALDLAAADDRTLFLPPGTYLISNINLPRRARITGIAGATRLVYTVAGHLLVGEDADLVQLTDLVFDGVNRPLAEYVPGIVHLTDVPNVRVEGCQFLGSGGSALAVNRCGGRITGNDISGAAEAGIRAIESTGLSVTDNIVKDCANNGILIYRWTEGEDGSLVIGNRVERIRADCGGTGPFGNGINVFRATNVTVAQNRIADCAFSAVRANNAVNVQIIGNNCSRLGEMALYSEFSFEGVVIANNIIDVAASGISVVNLDEGGRLATVSGNIIRDLTGQAPYPGGTFGVGLSVEADAAVTGNVIDGAPVAGMWIGWGPFLRNVAVTGNVIRDTPVGINISVVEGVGAALVTDNLIEGASDGAIFGTRWYERVTSDLTLAGAPSFSGLTVADNHVAR